MGVGGVEGRLAGLARSVGRSDTDRMVVETGLAIQYFLNTDPVSHNIKTIMFAMQSCSKQNLSSSSYIVRWVHDFFDPFGHSTRQKQVLKRQSRCN